MKDYLIWLNSGHCLEGTMENAEAKRLEQAFINQAPGILTFTDTDGQLHIYMSSILALSICKPNSKRIGYDQNTGKS